MLYLQPLVSHDYHMTALCGMREHAIMTRDQEEKSKLTILRPSWTGEKRRERKQDEWKNP